MKQAWGWLAAGVLAAGLNAGYHDGRLQWAHEIANQVGHSTNAVLALATGRAGQFVAEAQLASVQRQDSECPLAAALAQARTIVSSNQSEFDHFGAMSAREQAQLASVAAHRARIETEIVRIRIPAMELNRAVVASPGISTCPRVRVNVPRMPAIKIPAPAIVHVRPSDGGSV